MIMKRLFASIVLLHLTISVASARYQRAIDQSKREEAILARVTVYWAKGGSGSDRYTRNHKCATGLRLQTGHCAVDPKKIAYGSRLVFPDGTTLAAVDTGTAVKNRKAARKSGQTTYERNAIVVDRFFETKRQALSWASKNPLFMTVRVVPPIPSVVTQPLSQSARGTITGRDASARPAGKPGNNVLVASLSTVPRNPFNKLGR
jgi:3D (Asp-Asp-Asp) domain-containing protein